jgi:hypothetical protein
MRRRPTVTAEHSRIATESVKTEGMTAPSIEERMEPPRAAGRRSWLVLLPLRRRLAA